ncbi:MAG TPA: type II toxin-antitoxin system HigB family toxin [Anaerolineaceae bacterium]|nr:type II toxin-antitoxin system HigB family toxin [Anaerolineaceae bacterium]HPN52272.1 type II toxin-antitoxin system HigB family toxin [Anaerolineaceae bacterium]
MHVISIRKLQDFWEKHPEAKDSLESWYSEANHATWRVPEDIKKRYRGADFLPGNRVVFNIKGNTLRLIVCIHYNRGRVFIRFVGTHAEYDRIDAEKI